MNSYKKYEPLASYEKKCSYCKKSFLFGGSWEDYTYKVKVHNDTKFFCSWSCYRNYRDYTVRKKKKKCD